MELSRCCREKQHPPEIGKIRGKTAYGVDYPAASIRLNQSGVLPVCWAVVVIVVAKIESFCEEANYRGQKFTF